MPPEKTSLILPIIPEEVNYYKGLLAYYERNFLPPIPDIVKKILDSKETISDRYLEATQAITEIDYETARAKLRKIDLLNPQGENKKIDIYFADPDDLLAEDGYSFRLRVCYNSEGKPTLIKAIFKRQEGPLIFLNGIPYLPQLVFLQRIDSSEAGKESYSNLLKNLTKQAYSPIGMVTEKRTSADIFPWEHITSDCRQTTKPGWLMCSLQKATMARLTNSFDPWEHLSSLLTTTFQDSVNNLERFSSEKTEGAFFEVEVKPSINKLAVVRATQVAELTNMALDYPPYYNVAKASSFS